MRVLLLTADYPPHVWSGIGVAVERQARALAALGHDVDVLVAARDSAQPLAASVSTPRVRALARSRCPVDPGDFDLIHLHSLSLGGLALEWRRRTGIPLIYTAHSLVHLELDPTPHTAVWSAIQLQLMVASDHVIFLNMAERAAACALAPELATRCSVIPNGVSPPDPVAPPPPDGPIVFAGRFARSKGVDLLAEIIPRVLARWPGHFVLAGGHGDTEGERLVQDIVLRFPAHCRAPGWLDRGALDALFGQAALVVIPSRYEPFGLVAIEAMRCGAPVLAAAVGGLAEIVDNSSGGWAVHSRDPEIWSAAALELLATPALTAELRSRGPEHVARRFQIMHVAQRLEREVYAVQARQRRRAA